MNIYRNTCITPDIYHRKKMKERERERRTKLGVRGTLQVAYKPLIISMHYQRNSFVLVQKNLEFILKANQRKYGDMNFFFFFFLFLVLYQGITIIKASDKKQKCKNVKEELSVPYAVGFKYLFNLIITILNHC